MKASSHPALRAMKSLLYKRRSTATPARTVNVMVTASTAEGSAWPDMPIAVTFVQCSELFCLSGWTSLAAKVKEPASIDRGCLRYS